MSRRVVVHAGERYGRLVVLAEAGRRDRKRLYACACDCGAEVLVVGTRLRAAHGTRSCGCLQREVAAATATRSKRRHGHTAGGRLSPTWTSWACMLKRCTVPTAKDWCYYGGRGVTVCARWRDFELFLADMGERPAGHTLDRIDVEGDYEPANCRWATPAQQRANRRKREAKK